MQPLLRELLDLGLVDVGDNDAWYDFLESASEKLAGHFLKNPAKAIPAILVALDDDAGPDEPIFQLAEDVLREDWKGLRSRFKERPRPLLRVLLFDALQRAGGQSGKLASALWLSASRIYSHLRLGREASTFTRVLTSYAERLEKEAGEQGIDGGAMSPPNLSSVESPTPNQINNQFLQPNELLPLMQAALGPTEPKGQPCNAQFSRFHWTGGHTKGSKGPNPHWPSDGSYSEWCWAAAPRLEEVLLTAVNLGGQRLAEQLAPPIVELAASIQRAFEQHAQQLTAGIEQLWQRSNQISRTAKLKTEVLWWLEALYSPSLRTSYRALPSLMAVVAMSHDLFGVVAACQPPPASVVHVLGEAVNRLKETGYDRKYALSEVLAGVQEHGPMLRDLVTAPADAVGRRPLLQVVETSVYQAAPSERDLLAQTGLRGDESVSLPELAMWCFQDLQARSLCEQEGRA